MYLTNTTIHCQYLLDCQRYTVGVEWLIFLSSAHMYVCFSIVKIVQKAVCVCMFTISVILWCRASPLWCQIQVSRCAIRNNPVSRARIAPNYLWSKVWNERALTRSLHLTETEYFGYGILCWRRDDGRDGTFNMFSVWSCYILG